MCPVTQVECLLDPLCSRQSAEDCQLLHIQIIKHSPHDRGEVLICNKDRSLFAHMTLPWMEWLASMLS